MTLAITIDIILSAIVLIAIVGSLARAIRTSRDAPAIASTKIESDDLHGPSHTPSRIRTGDFLRERQAS